VANAIIDVTIRSGNPGMATVLLRDKRMRNSGKKKIGKIFNPFYTTKQNRPTGPLGWEIAKEGGRLSSRPYRCAEAVAGEGTELSISIPLADRRPRCGSTATLNGAAAAHGFRMAPQTASRLSPAAVPPMGEFSSQSEADHHAR